jgi:hypothetical protein
MLLIKRHIHLRVKNSNFFDFALDYKKLSKEYEEK